MQTEQLNRVIHTMQALAAASEELIKVKYELSHDMLTVERQKEVLKAISNARDSITTARLLIELLDE